MDSPILIDIRSCVRRGKIATSVSPKTRSLLKKLVNVIAHASAGNPGAEIDTSVACWDTSGDSACGGTILALLTDVPNRITWRCSRCGINGIVFNWRGSPWDKSDRFAPGRQRRYPQICEVMLSEVEYAALLTFSVREFETIIIIQSARRTRDGIQLLCTVDDMRGISELIGLNHSCAPDTDPAILSHLRGKIDRSIIESAVY